MKSAVKALLFTVLTSWTMVSGSSSQCDSLTLLRQAPTKAQAQKNVYKGNGEALLAGKKLFLRHCAGCHGEDSKGTEDAPSLQSAAIRSASPGVLVWFLKNGNLRRGMPSWSRLPEQQLWQIVTHLQQ
jgi:mono/diheme cytochrome c family protein